MNEKDIIRAAMEVCGWNQETLAKNAGYTTQSSISSRLNGKSMRVDTFVKLLAAMGYEVTVRSTSPRKNSKEWTINYEETAPSYPKGESSAPAFDLDKLLDTKSESSIFTPEGKIRLK